MNMEVGTEALTELSVTQLEEYLFGHHKYQFILGNSVINGTRAERRRHVQ